MYRFFLRLFDNRRSYSDIAPDEIFLDSSNLPSFDKHQFEGRMERPIGKASVIGLGIVLIVFALILLGKMWSLQIMQGEAFAEQSENNRLDHSIIFAERGLIYDRQGEMLAWNLPREDEFFARRTFTDLPGLSHLLGYVGYPARDSAGFYYEDEYVGRAGAEKVFDAALKGVNGKLIVETNARGEIVGRNVVEPPRDGSSVALSVDAGVQSALFDAISSLARDKGFRGGSGAIMNVKNGELLALASYPEFDSGIMTEGEDVETINRYQNQSNAPFLNRAIAGQYTPGSIIKPFVAYGALAEDIVSPQKTFYSSGSISVPNPYDPDKPTIFTDWKAHGTVDMRRALSISSNIYFYHIGGGFESQEGLGIDRIEKYLKLFGFGEPVNIVLSGEEIGVIPNPAWKADRFDGDIWRIGDTYNTAIGQYGMQATPMQAVRATAALASNGMVLEPHILQGQEPIIARTIAGETIDFEIVKEGMRDAVQFGTAQGVSVPYVKVAAKTGTAEVGISKSLVNSWVIGFFPYDDPEYAFAILMERGPVKNLVGGTYVMRQVLDWIQENRPEYFN